MGWPRCVSVNRLKCWPTSWKDNERPRQLTVPFDFHIQINDGEQPVTMKYNPRISLSAKKCGVGRAHEPEHLRFSYKSVAQETCLLEGLTFSLGYDGRLPVEIVHIINRVLHEALFQKSKGHPQRVAQAR